MSENDREWRESWPPSGVLHEERMRSGVNVDHLREGEDDNGVNEEYDERPLG